MPRWIAPTALLVSLIAAAAAGWALLKPSPPAAAPAPESQGVYTKATTCSAFQTVSTAVSLQTHGDPGADPAAIQGVAANARLAMSAGATYLLAHLDSATPADLAEAVRTFASGLQDISMYALAGVPNSDEQQSARLRDAEAANNRIAELCK
ncbi:hypothetical protein B1R94_08245 [Mycolicibacterium litorale]|nr:hypothetical protein B1R94_08245 [Mycolicibacterium litorale]